MRKGVEMGNRKVSPAEAADSLLDVLDRFAGGEQVDVEAAIAAVKAAASGVWSSAALEAVETAARAVVASRTKWTESYSGRMATSEAVLARVRFAVPAVRAAIDKAEHPFSAASDLADAEWEVERLERERQEQLAALRAALEAEDVRKAREVRDLLEIETPGRIDRAALRVRELRLAAAEEATGPTQQRVAATKKALEESTRVLEEAQKALQAAEAEHQRCGAAAFDAERMLVLDRQEVARLRAELDEARQRVEEEKVRRVDRLAGYFDKPQPPTVSPPEPAKLPNWVVEHVGWRTTDEAAEGHKPEYESAAARRAQQGPPKMVVGKDGWLSLGPRPEVA
jgi:hypothetical protein